MIDQQVRDKVFARLWPARSLSTTGVWAILDGARDPRVFPTVRDSGLNYACLYSGHLPRELQLVAPYLVELNPDDPFTRRIIDLAWGNCWGVFLKVSSDARLRHHLRGFLRVQSEAGRKLLFRYYDPRVLRVYLPTCRLDELKAVFGPIRSFVVEGPQGRSLTEFEFDGFRMTQRVDELGGQTGGSLVPHGSESESGA